MSDNKLLDLRRNKVEITIDILIETFNKATELGSQAANAQVSKLAMKEVAPGKLLDACGGSNLNLQIDGRSRTAKLINSIDNPNINVSKSYSGGYCLRLPYEINIKPPVNGQEQSISYAADKAAAKYIEDTLGIRAYALSYDS